LAPESLLVFEVKDNALPSFIKAVEAIEGLNLVGEDDIVTVDGEKTFLYLLLPTQAAITKLLAHWKKWSSDEPLPDNAKPWERAFLHLHDLRRWGPKDRITEEDARFIADQASHDPKANVRVEIELVFEARKKQADEERQRTEAALTANDASVVHRSRIEAIAYDALLVDISYATAKALVDRDAKTIAGIPDLYAIRPQSLVNLHEDAEGTEAAAHVDFVPTEPAIAAIIDSMPVQNHPVYAQHIEIIDPDDLGAKSVGIRAHGTAMTSLVVRGDLKRQEPPLNHKVVVRPIMYADAPNDTNEVFDRDRLLVDDFVRAVLDLKKEPNAATSDVFVVNVSLGDRHRPFGGKSSPWARALDWLAHEYGLLFIVSAGNAVHNLELVALASEQQFAALQGEERAKATLAALQKALPHRRLLSPAEAVNAVTVGALHHDDLETAPSVGNSYDPLPVLGLPTPVSRYGPGVGNAIKPDILMPGGRLRVSLLFGQQPPALRICKENRHGGLQVASARLDVFGQLSSDAWSGATSGAAALGTRASHFVHDSLLSAYPQVYGELSTRFKALLIKALLLHRCSIDEEARALVRAVFGPSGKNKHAKRADNVFRVFGYGVPALDEVTACLENRATLWGTGSLTEDSGLLFKLPLPDCLSGHHGFRKVSVTLTWFSSVTPGRRAYRSERLIVEEPTNAHLRQIVTNACEHQADKNRVSRGTVFSRAWHGKSSRNFVKDAVFEVRIVRKPDNLDDLPIATDFACVATLEAENRIPIYDEIKAKILIKPQLAVPIPVLAK
jgi:Subtilase family